MNVATKVIMCTIMMYNYTQQYVYLQSVCRPSLHCSMTITEDMFMCNILN